MTDLYIWVSTASLVVQASLGLVMVIVSLLVLYAIILVLRAIPSGFPSVQNHEITNDNEPPSPWFKISLTPEQVSDGLAEGIPTVFKDVFLDFGKPKGWALFVDSRLGSEPVFYFTPDSWTLAMNLVSIYGGDPLGSSQCEPPEKDDVTFLAGDAKAKRLFS